MSTPDKGFKSLVRELKKFDLPSDQFAIFGSGPAGVRGLLSRKISDLDLIVTKALWEKLSSQYPTKKGKWRDRKIDLAKDIEVWEDLLSFYKPGEAERMIKEADVIDGIRYVKLEAVVSLKKFLNRPKDRRDIKAIEGYLKKTR